MDCSICLEPISSIITLKCNHKFHYNCIINLIIHSNNPIFKCPNCRKTMNHCNLPFITESIDELCLLLFEESKETVFSTYSEIEETKMEIAVRYVYVTAKYYNMAKRLITLNIASQLIAKYNYTTIIEIANHVNLILGKLRENNKTTYMDFYALL
jgi:hypothetical protein